MPAVHSFIKSLKRPPNVTRKSWSSRVSYLHKRARDFVVEIFLLLTRVRKSFLYDHGGFSAKELEELVTRTGLCNNAGSTPRLIIFLLQESIFVLNVNDIGSIYASFTACEQNPAFVNVARNLKSPSVLPDDHSFVQACREEFQLIITFLTESARQEIEARKRREAEEEKNRAEAEASKKRREFKEKREQTITPKSGPVVGWGVAGSNDKKGGEKAAGKCRTRPFYKIDAADAKRGEETGGRPYLKKK
eukprot:Stramenopile-MAST_4_protein_6417